MSNRASDTKTTSAAANSPSSSSSPPNSYTITPDISSSNPSARPSPPLTSRRDIATELRMDANQATALSANDEQAGATEESEVSHQQQAAVDPTERETATTDAATGPTTSTSKTHKKKSKCPKYGHQKPKKADKARKHDKSRREVSSDSDSSCSDSDSDSSDDSESDSESDSSDEPRKKSKSSRHNKRSSKKSKISSKRKSKRSRKQVESETESDDYESDEDIDPLDLPPPDLDRRKPRRTILRSGGGGRRTRKIGRYPDIPSDTGLSAYDDEYDEGEETAQSIADLEHQLALARIKAKQNKPSRRRRASFKSHSSSKRRREKASRKDDALQFKRVDELWDRELHQFKLRESAEGDDSEFAEFAFLVRRTFDWENKYRDTVVDIKAKPLRDALREIMKGAKSVSLEADEPSIDPNMLFLYLEELRLFYKDTLKQRVKEERKRKVIKKLRQQRSLVKMLVGYIDEDYEETKKTLYPLLKAGNITFDLLWALFKPNDTVVTSCYGVWDDPRCFRMEYANKCCSMTRGEWYAIEGKYLEYDGKGFGFGDFEVTIESFKGPRKISSLAAYPLKYHKEPEKVREQILARAQSFVDLEGMHYKYLKGLAFAKKKGQVLKININGRIMVDPATFRRINPNYPISVISPKKNDDLFDLYGEHGSDGSDDEDGCSCGGHSDDEAEIGNNEALSSDPLDAPTPKYKYKWTKDDKGGMHLAAVEVDADGDPLHVPKALDTLSTPSAHPELREKTFTEEELLLTSPVVLGFAFSEKLWLEFSLSAVHEITHNEAAFDSLVLPPNQKSIVRALVESHKFNAAQTIDDVVQGKGKGLVAVLHGPPGTGKTLTAEGISELLKCPLYMVSAGELGTESARLEMELQKILDIAHSWGAVLLLDEADVFLEKREVHDIHRNALVSIFLRLLEYFQGILFLTTNRVETFDDAFQSRIHVALRYGELSAKAKKTVWRMFIDKVRAVDGMEVAAFPGEELEMLSRHSLNGRQIKNVVRTAQALALNEKQMLTLDHIKRVLDVAETFERDLKGGTGYVDAMRSYT